MTTPLTLLPPASTASVRVGSAPLPTPRLTPELVADALSRLGLLPGPSPFPLRLRQTQSPPQPGAPTPLTTLPRGHTLPLPLPAPATVPSHSSPWSAAAIMEAVSQHPDVQVQTQRLEAATRKKGVLGSLPINWSLLNSPANPNYSMGQPLIGKFLDPTLKFDLWNPGNRAKLRTLEIAAMTAFAVRENSKQKYAAEALKTRAEIANLNFSLDAQRAKVAALERQARLYGRLASGAGASATQLESLAVQRNLSSAYERLNNLQSRLDENINKFAGLTGANPEDIAAQLPGLRQATRVASSSRFVDRFLARQPVHDDPRLSTQPSRFLPLALRQRPNVDAAQVDAYMNGTFGSPGLLASLWGGEVPVASAGRIDPASVDYSVQDPRIARFMTAPRFEEQRRSFIAGLPASLRNNLQGGSLIAALPGSAANAGILGSSTDQATLAVQQWTRTSEGLAYVNKFMSVRLRKDYKRTDANHAIGYVRATENLTPHFAKNNIDYAAMIKRFEWLLANGRAHTLEAVRLGQILTLHSTAQEVRARGKGFSLVIKPLSFLAGGPVGGAFDTVIANVARIAGNFTGGRDQREAIVEVEGKLYEGIASILAENYRDELNARLAVRQIAGTGAGSTVQRQANANESMRIAADSFGRVHRRTVLGAESGRKAIFEAYLNLIDATTEANTFASREFTPRRVDLAFHYGQLGDPNLLAALDAQYNLTPISNGSISSGAFFPSVAALSGRRRPQAPATASAAPAAPTTTAARK
jgi:hypothetical protein